MICELCGRPFKEKIDWSLYFYPAEAITKTYLCPQCQKEWIPIDDIKHCPYCGEWKKVSEHCECERWRQSIPFFKHHSLYCYNELTKEWLNRYKIQGDYQLRMIIGKSVREKLSNYKKYTIVPIPLDVDKYYQRGFNQVEGVLEAANISYQRLLSKSLILSAQGLKTRKERLETLQPFCVNHALDENQFYLVVDDIYTTGRTITHAYQALESAGAKHIQSFSFLRA